MSERALTVREGKWQVVVTSEVQPGINAVSCKTGR